MKKALLLIAFLCVPVFAQEHEPQNKPENKPGNKLVQFQMALVKRGSNAFPPNWQNSPVRRQHIQYVSSLIASGKAMIAGPVKNDPELAGVIIFRTQSAEEALGWINGDPAVAARFFTIETHPWWSEDVMKKPASFEGTTTAYLAFLMRGDKWTPEKTPATEAIQKAHIDNINRLAAMKKLVVAGPFGDDGTLRGIFVFKVNTLEEAQELANTDPAVKAGRLALKIRPWEVPDGILP